MEKKIRNLIVILSFLFLLIRLPFLDQLFLLHDERDIVFSGYSIAKTGKDLFGHPFPISFTGISPNNPLTAIYYSAFWSFINPVRSVFYARLPFVLVSTLLVFLVYQLVHELTKDKTKSLLTTAFFCFSPWVFHITRLALDIPLAIVTLLAGMIFYVRRKTLLAYVFFFLTFYNYQGFRLLIPFVVVYLELFFYLQKHNWRPVAKNLLINGGLVTLLFLSTLFIEAGAAGGRIKEIIFFNTEKTAAEVNFQRLTSVAPDEIKKIFSNKLTVAGDYILTNFVKGQDLIYLFKEGDYSAINGNTASGQFFFVFIILYYLGIASLGRKSKKEDLYVIGFSFIGMIPSLLSTNGSSFSIRAMLSGIGFAYLLSLGTLFILNIMQKNKRKNLAITLFTLLLITHIVYFSYTYYFRRPVTVGELFNENERQIANYVMEKGNRPKTIYDRMSQDIYLSIVFFDNRTNIKDVQDNLKKGDHYQYNDYTLIRCYAGSNYPFFEHSIVAKGCLTPKSYDYLDDINNKKVIERIKYKDYSDKTAYFVTE